MGITSLYARGRANPRIRATARVMLVVVLAALAFGYIRLDDGAREDRDTTDAAVAILATSCGATSFADLRAAGLLEECRLARAGELQDELPKVVTEDNPPAPGAAADVIPDDPDVPPSQVTLAPTTEQVKAAVEPAVESYLAANPIPPTPDYQRSIRRSVVRYLTLKPPEPGPGPTQTQVQNAVRDVLLANPPDDGTDGTDGAEGATGDAGPVGQAGRGIARASLDGCDVVFTYSDGTTDTVGPLCAPPPTDTQIAQAFAAYCEANGECRGPAGIVQITDACEPAADGRFLTDAALRYDPETSTLTITCTSGGLLE